MDVIKTPTAVADKFGAGLNGFRSESPGLPATQLSPEWADSVQMEIVNVIISQGIALDDLVFDQMATAIASYSFTDPKVSGSLTIEGGAMLFVESLGTVEMLAGSGLVLRNGSTFAVEANVTLVAADNTWTWGSSNTNDWTINGNVTLGTNASSVVSLVGDVGIGFDATSVCSLNGTYTLDGSITGGIGTLLDAETVEADRLQLVSTGSVSTDAGVLSFGGRFLAFGLSATAKRVAIFDESYVAGGSTGLAVADTGASVTIVLAVGDKVMVDISIEASNSIGGSRVRVWIDVNGANIGSTSDFLPPAANERIAIAKHVPFTAAASIAYTFKLRTGAPNGGTTTFADAFISVRHRH